MQDRVTTPIRISETDYKAITNLLETIPYQKRGEFDELEEELARAEILPSEQMPRDVVTMYSTVVYEDLESGMLMMVKLTSPKDASIEEGRVSILAPIGAALLGLKVGQEIAWPLPDGRMGRVRVKQLVQPLEAGPWLEDESRAYQ
jgi:regulator of nucleoside diphosphate kinase